MMQTISTLYFINVVLIYHRFITNTYIKLTKSSDIHIIFLQITINFNLWTRSHPNHCTEVRFSSFLSSGFNTAIVVNPPKRKLAKCTSVHCALPQFNFGTHQKMLNEETVVHIGIILQSRKRNDKIKETLIQNFCFCFQECLMISKSLKMNEMRTKVPSLSIFRWVPKMD